MKKQLINLEPVKDVVRTKLLEKYNSTLFMNTDTVEIKIDIKEILEDYIEAQELTEPEIFITSDAYIKMRKLVDDNTTEIGWYGTVTQMPGLNAYVIEDIIVYPQTVTGTTCEQDDDKMFEFEMSLTTDQVNHKRFHGHSHVNMGTSPSGVDENFYQDLLSQTNDYFIITITNKRNEYTTRFYDIANNILYTDIPIQVLFTDGTDVESWFEGTTDKLTQHTYTNPYKQKNIWDEEDDDDRHVWDESFGYVTRAEQRELRRAYNASEQKRGRGRPRLCKK